MKPAEFDIIVDELTKETIKVIDELIEEEIKPMIEYRQAQEKKIFDKAYKEVKELEVE